MKSISSNIIFKQLHRKTIRVIDEFRNIVHFYDSENKLAIDNQNYWNKDYSDPTFASHAHWNDKGVFEDHQRWLNLGKEHLDLISDYSSVTNLRLPVKQIVEWGCGGGANAVHFAPLTEKFIGIDITTESLSECNKQLLKFGFNNFKPILINALTPKTILNEKISNIDLFICTYVYELFPSPEYGINVLKLANEMLTENGIAFIHIRYNDGKRGLRSKRWGYKKHPYSMTTYSIEEFWEKSKDCGFQPLGIYLKPHQPLVNDDWYAYYFLKKVKPAKQQ